MQRAQDPPDLFEQAEGTRQTLSVVETILFANVDQNRLWLFELKRVIYFPNLPIRPDSNSLGNITLPSLF
jgi:hypothetical protein